MASLIWRPVLRRFHASSSLSAGAKKGDYKIFHDPPQAKFIMKLNSQYAYVEYEKQGQVFDLVVTSIPDAYAGKGLSRILGELTMEYIIKANWKMRISCPLLQKLYDKNPKKYKKHVVK